MSRVSAEDGDSLGGYGDDFDDDDDYKSNLTAAGATSTPNIVPAKNESKPSLLDAGPSMFESKAGDAQDEGDSDEYSSDGATGSPPTRSIRAPGESRTAVGLSRPVVPGIR